MPIQARLEGDQLFVDGVDLKRAARTLRTMTAADGWAPPKDLVQALEMTAKLFGFPNLHAAHAGAKRVQATADEAQRQSAPDSATAQTHFLAALFKRDDAGRALLLGPIAPGSEALHQHDADVFLQILNMAKVTPAGAPIGFATPAMISSLGWPKTGAYYELLEQCLTRLFRAALLTDAQLDTSRSTWRVSVDANLVQLLPVNFTNIDLDVRKRLTPLAKWAQVFFATMGSTEESTTYSLEDLQRLVGLENLKPRDFKAKLTVALDLLVDSGAIASAEFEEDRVRVRPLG